jgi:(2R)-3-sulfolactate dehydrogenase (NADP+)
MPVLTLDQIESLCANALKRAGASDEQAAIVAEEIMDAEAEGIRNVGLGYLHLYLKHLRCGKVNPAAAPKIVKTSESTTLVDADFGFCHHAYVIAEERLIETTRAQGEGLISIHQSSSAYELPVASPRVSGISGWMTTETGCSPLWTTRKRHPAPSAARQRPRYRLATS